MSLKEKLEQASKKAETQKTERRARTVKGSHLNPQFLEAAANAGLTVTPSKSGAYQVITGAAGKAKRVYVATRGGVVDFNGFTVQSGAVSQFTEDEAKRLHLGLVRGRLNFDAPDTDVMAAFRLALGQLNVPVVKPAKEPKAPRAPRAPKAPEAEATAPAQA